MGTSGRFFIDNKAGIARLADDAHATGIFLVVEVVDWGPLVKPETRVELLTIGARVAAELGGDVVKVPYLGSVEEMRKLVSVCPVPVLALGGPNRRGRADSDDQGRSRSGRSRDRIRAQHLAGR